MKGKILFCLVLCLLLSLCGRTVYAQPSSFNTTDLVHQQYETGLSIKELQTVERLSKQYAIAPITIMAILEMGKTMDVVELHVAKLSAGYQVLEEDPEKAYLNLVSLFNADYDLVDQLIARCRTVGYINDLFL